MTDGCEQRERFPAGLTTGRFLVDEMSFETLIAMSAGLASHLTFFNLQQVPAGTWGEMFEVDEALVIARIISTDLVALQTRHQGEDSLNLALCVMALAKHIDGWYKTLNPGDTLVSRRLRTRIAQLITQSLAAELGQVCEFLIAHQQSEVVAKDKKKFDSIWDLSRMSADRLITTQNDDREFLRSRLFSFTAAMEDVQVLAREVLPVSLKSQTHAPGAGMLMGFLQLFNVVQAQINRFTDRHADFYYEDCLRMQPLVAVPDRLHLVFQRDLRADREVVIARGTSFIAGKDEAGQPIEFRADDRLLVTDAQVVSLLTLRQDRNPLISPEHELGYITRSEALRLEWPASSLPAADTAPQHWPLLGGTSLGAPERNIALNKLEDMRLGLAIASPLLLLGEGQRTITLTLGLIQPIEADEPLLILAARVKASTSRIKRRLMPILCKRYLQLMPELLSATELKQINVLAMALSERMLSRPVPGEQSPLVADTPDEPNYYECFITELTIQATTDELFFKRLGRLFTRWLLARGDWLSDQALLDLRTHAKLFLPDSSDRTEPVAGDPRCLIQGPATNNQNSKFIRPARALIFAQYFNSFFDFSLSTPTGWKVVKNFFVKPVEADKPADWPGLQVVLTLRPEDPPVTGYIAALHGAQFTTGLPVLRMQLHGQGRIYPYSLLADLQLTDVTLIVQVQGVRDLVLYNQLGRLDASKSFMPFGPLPTTSSYLVFGASELTCKHVTKLHANVEWAELPHDDRGFASYYADYGNMLRNNSFTAMPGILRDGQWQPGDLSTQCLFTSLDTGGRINAGSSLAFDELALRTHDWASPEPLDYSASRSSGFYRLQLTGPVGAFGHQAYPGLLTKLVSANATHRRKRPLSLPNAPYTPQVERLTLDYEAQTNMVLHSETGLNEVPQIERVWQLHPFGVEQIYPGLGRSSPTLLPRVDHDGNLFIGIEATNLQGLLTLHFQLRGEDTATSMSLGSRPPISWAYLSNNHWYALRPDQVITNTTSGFLTSGIVTLDVPGEINRCNTILSADCYWLRVSVDAELDTFASLCGVRTHSLHATRVIDGKFAAPTAHLPSGSVTEPAATIVGLSAVAQIGPSYGLRPAEDRRQKQTRIGERLQHRQRASTPWDYERLVLERFPAVLKVKCFPGQARRQGIACSGKVLVVVVPRPHPQPATGDDADLTNATPIVSATAAPHLHADELQDIQAYLRSLASPFAQIQVRNPAYERIQVRCTVQPAAGSQPGQTVRLVNRAITDFLSPWREPGYKPNFNWTVRCEDIEAYVRNLDCVHSIAQISLLHVAHSDGGDYTLGDTARSVVGLASQVGPLSSWSLALPMDEHIVTLVEQSTEAPPVATGIAELSIANTFILGKTIS